MVPVSIVTMVSPACFVSSMSRLPKPQLETDCVDKLTSVRAEAFGPGPRCSQR